MALSAQLLDSTIRHQVYLERLKSGEVNQFAAFLRRMDETLRERLTREDLTDFSRQRLERLIDEVDALLAGIFTEHFDSLSGSLLDLAEYEAGFEARAISAAVPSFEATIPAANQIRAAVFSMPLSVKGADGGKLLETFIQDYSSNERKRLTGAIRRGFFEGKTNFQIIQELRGTRAKKYTDGLLNITSRNAEAIVRTSVQHAASVARFETWNDNSDIVTGYRWVSTLDSRTTTQCRSLDGRVFKVGKGPKPPIHIRCRSTTVAELNGNYSFLQDGQTRASKDGYVGDQDYYTWLKTQPAKFQDSVLGPARAKLFREGGLSAERFARLNLDRNFMPLSLAEMRDLEPLAFERAGI